MPSGNHISVVGGGVAGLTAAISAAEAGARVTLYEAHRSLGGRARTADGPYLTNEGPHALYRRGPHWSWLRLRGLLEPLAKLPPLEGSRFRFHRGGVLRRVPPLGLLRLSRRGSEQAPVDADFMTWATEVSDAATARAAAHFTSVALFHHDPGSLSAAFVQERLRRAAALPPEAAYPRGGWSRLVGRMASHARSLGVRIDTSARVDAVPEDTPVIVATSLDAARRLLKDDSLRWTGGRTALLDLALSAGGGTNTAGDAGRGTRRRTGRGTGRITGAHGTAQGGPAGRSPGGEPFVVSDLDAPGWLERFTAQDSSLAPAGEHLLQGQFPIGPDETKADGIIRAEGLLDLAFPEWRGRTVWRRESLAAGRTGAVDLPGTTWRDRPGIDRGRDHGLYLAGDQVAAPGVLSEVSFNSGIRAAALAVRQLRTPRTP